MKTKKLTSILAAAVLGCTMLPLNAAAYDCCDTQRDGDVDIMDQIYLSRYLLGEFYLNDPSIMDTNGNYIIDDADSLYIMAKIVDLNYTWEFFDVTAE